MEKVGSHNDRGMLNSFLRKGFTDAKCLNELIANTIDNDANDIFFNINKENIILSDNGNGMDIEKIKDMFEIGRENHGSEKKLGVSGLGAKPAMSNLNKQKDMYLITKKLNEPCYTVVIPWETMFEQGKYQDMVSRRKSDKNEIKNFIELRIFLKEPLKGTSIYFNYNNDLDNLITNQFENDSDLTHDDLIANVFSRFGKNIILNHFEKGKFELNQYDYIGKPGNEYYGGKDRCIIECYEHPGYSFSRYIYNSSEFEYLNHNQGKKSFSKKITTKIKSLDGWVKYGKYVVLCRHKVIKDYFDPNNPKLPKHASGYISGKTSKIITNGHLIRNNQFIGLISLDENVKDGSGRGCSELYFKINGIQCEIKYSPISDQKNKQDLEIGIQEVKGQYIDNKIPKNLHRMFEYIKFEIGQKIWNKMKEDSEIEVYIKPENKIDIKPEIEVYIKPENKIDIKPEVELEPETGEKFNIDNVMKVKEVSGYISTEPNSSKDLIIVLKDFNILWNTKYNKITGTNKIEKGISTFIKTINLLKKYLDDQIKNKS